MNGFYLKKPAPGTEARAIYERQNQRERCPCGSGFRTIKGKPCLRCNPDTADRFAAMHKGSKQ